MVKLPAPTASVPAPVITPDPIVESNSTTAAVKSVAAIFVPVVSVAPLFPTLPISTLISLSAADISVAA